MHVVHEVLRELDAADVDMCLEVYPQPMPIYMNTGSSAIPPYLPSQCSICFLMSLPTSQHELIASLVLAQRLPLLEKIWWSSYFASDADFDQGRTQMTGVGQRQDWKIMFTVERSRFKGLKVKRSVAR